MNCSPSPDPRRVNRGRDEERADAVSIFLPTAADIINRGSMLWRLLAHC